MAFIDGTILRAGRTQVPKSQADNMPLIFTSLVNGAQFEIRGADLPHQGTTVRQALRMEREKYPGTDEVVTQVMGLDFDDLVFEGTLRDEWHEQGHTRAFIDIAKTFHAQGHLCELSYGSVLIREGIIESFSHTLDRDGSATYELTFSPDNALDIIQSSFFKNKRPIDTAATKTASTDTVNQSAVVTSISDEIEGAPFLRTFQ